MMYGGLVGVLKSILEDVGIPEIAVITEAKGLRASELLRPGYVVVLDVFDEGRHLVLDAVVTFVYRNSVMSRSHPFGDI